MRLRILATLSLALAFSAGLPAQEIPEEAGPYEPLALDVTDISAMIADGQIPLALDSLETMIRRDTLDDALRYYHGLCLLAGGDIAGAADDFSRAIALDPDNSNYYEQLFNAYSSLGTPEARRSADSLCVVMAERFPRKYRTPYILTMMGDNALYTENNDSLALHLYEEALAIEDDYAPALLGKAEACIAANNYVGYFSSMESFAAVEYVSPDAKCRYIRRLLERVDGPTYRVWHNQIDGLVETCARTHPTDSSALVLAGQWFYPIDKEKGISYFRQWKDTNPDNVGAALLWISITASNGSDADAIAACDEALSHFKGTPDEVQLLCTKADYLYKSGRKSKAFRTYEKALKKNPSDPTVLNNYAYFLSLEKRNLSKAEKMSRKAVDADPDNVSYLDTYGYILYLLKRPAEAKTYFKRAIIYGGKDDEAVLRHYAQVLEALGENDLARYYRSLIETRTK